jgi:hypothetical protein
MLTLKDFHSNYKRSVKENINTVELKLREVQNEYNVILDRVNRMKTFIDDCVINSSFDELMSTRNHLIFYNLRFNSNIKNYDVDKEKITIIFSTKLTYDKTINKIKNSLNRLKTIRTQIDNKVFNFIITNFNKAVIDEIIKGYKFVPTGLGPFFVIRRQRGRRPVDWGRSNAYKQTLLEKGLVPYNKETAPDGEQWLFYHEGEYGHYYRWGKNYCSFEHKDPYKFVPTSGPKGNVNRLHEYIKDNPEVIFNYKTIDIR